MYTQALQQDWDMNKTWDHYFVVHGILLLGCQNEAEDQNKKSKIRIVWRAYSH